MVSDIAQRRTSSALPLKSFIKLLQWSRGYIAYTDIKWVLSLQRSCHNKVFHKYAIKRTVFLLFTLLQISTVWHKALCFILYIICARKWLSFSNRTCFCIFLERPQWLWSVLASPLLSYSLVGGLSVRIKMFCDAQHVNSSLHRAADIDASG